MESIKLGAFSISLTVKDIYVSKAFYEKLGFYQRGGDITKNWVVMKNGDTIVGLFQGMFDKNMLTFNPGWNQEAQHLDDFVDVRDIQKHLLAQEVELQNKADETTDGPAYIILTDPDGNPILIDQHR